MTNNAVHVHSRVRTRLLSLLLVGAMLVVGRPAAARLEHVVLVDVSGSMGATWADHSVRDAFAHALLANPKVVAGRENLIVRTFTTRQNPSFPDDPCRLWPRSGGQPAMPAGDAEQRAVAAGVLDAVKTTSGDTDLNAAWRAGLAEKQQWCHDAPGIVWIVTDNWQDPDGSGVGNLDAFYHDLKSNPQVLAVILVPLIRNPNGVQGNIVLYAILHGPANVASQVEAEFATRTRALAEAMGREAPFSALPPRMITCKFHPSREPALRQVSIDFTPGDPEVSAHVEGNNVVVEGLRPGKPLEGQLHFNLESRLAEWRLVGARLRPARLRFDTPANGIVAQPNDGEWRISPPHVSINPGNVAAIRYSIDATGNRALFVPEAEGGAMRRLFPGAEDVVPARMDLAVIVDVQRELMLDSNDLRAAAQHVRMLDGIQQLLQGTTDLKRGHQVQIPIHAATLEFRVDATRRFLGVAVGIWIVLLLLGGLAGGLIPGVIPQKGFFEHVPGETEAFTVAAFGRPHRVSHADIRLGEVRAGYPSGMKFVPASKCRLTGESRREVLVGAEPVTFTLSRDAVEHTLRIGRGEPR